MTAGRPRVMVAVFQPGRRVGGGLNSAVDNYNKFVASFEGRVLVSARRFRDLKGMTPREFRRRTPIDHPEPGRGPGGRQTPG